MGDWKQNWVVWNRSEACISGTVNPQHLHPSARILLQVTIYRNLYEKEFPGPRIFANGFIFYRGWDRGCSCHIIIINMHACISSPCKWEGVSATLFSTLHGIVLYLPQPTRGIEPMLCWSWPTVFVVCPISTQHWLNVSCLLGSLLTLSVPNIIRIDSFFRSVLYGSSEWTNKIL